MAQRALGSLRAGRATVFMLHRFSMPELGIAGHDPAELRSSLDHLRRSRFELISLAEVLRRLREGEDVTNAVAFTIDDGYEEQAEIAGPIFAEFDCPVTTFVCTGFLDRAQWMWWDKIEHVMRETTLERLAVEIADQVVRLDLSDEVERQLSQLSFTQACKLVSADARQAAIGKLAVAAEVEIPAEPPPAYAPMSWEQLRRRESGGHR